MTGDILILGYGPVGRATAERLRSAGRSFRIAQRSRPDDLPQAVPFVPCDVLDAASMRAAIAGAAQVVAAIGLEYSGKIWEECWPTAMRNLLDACAAVRARVVFLDNLYMYGPADRPLTEDMPLAPVGRKPTARALITRMWQSQDQVRVAALRAPDFYGPGVTLSHLGTTGLGAIARGKPAFFTFPPDQPHAWAYVPDIGRAIVTLLDADDTAFGQAWHMPCPPTLTSRQLLAIGAAVKGAPSKVRIIPPLLLRLLAPFWSFAREMQEMKFQWDRPYEVDASKWRARFWSDVTPHEEGVARTIRSFQ